jgi:hypothetical protein
MRYFVGRRFRYALVFAASIALFLICLDSPALAGGKRLRPECAESHGDYTAPGAYDEYGECILTLTTGDQDAATDAIISIVSESNPQCADLLYWLEGEAQQMEWTGNYHTSYEWDARTDPVTGVVAFHYDVMGDAVLWAHEGAHGIGNWDEETANWLADICTNYVIG